jgi:hypothetical protein
MRTIPSPHRRPAHHRIQSNFSMPMTPATITAHSGMVPMRAKAAATPTANRSPVSSSRASGLRAMRNGISGRVARPRATTARTEMISA